MESHDRGTVKLVARHSLVVLALALVPAVAMAETTGSSSDAPTPDAFVSGDVVLPVGRPEPEPLPPGEETLVYRDDGGCSAASRPNPGAWRLASLTLVGLWSLGVASHRR